MVRIYNKKVGTLRAYLNAGYTLESGEVTKQAGYLSRKLEGSEFLDQPVYIVEKGRRAGRVFILRPSWRSTRYCYRVYLRYKY